MCILLICFGPTLSPLRPLVHYSLQAATEVRSGHRFGICTKFHMIFPMSRFADIGVDGFVSTVAEYGFKPVSKKGGDDDDDDGDKSYFVFLDFKKVQNCGKKKKLPAVTLKPCFYKKR